MKNEKQKYRRISFPIPLLDKIKSHIYDKPEYQNISEFIREAIREKIRNELIEDYQIKNNVDDEEDVELSINSDMNSTNNISDNYNGIKGEISMFI